MAMEAAASGPETGNAGKEDALAKAFATAVEGKDFADVTFKQDALEPDEPAEAQPVESEKTEDAAPDKPEGKVAKTVAKEAEPDLKPTAKFTDEIKAPAHWNAHWRDAFSSLPPEGRKFALDLAKSFEADYTRKSTELAEDRKFAQSVKSLITPAHRMQMERAGLRDDQGLAHLVGLNDFFTRDPDGYLRFVVERSGRDPRQIWPELFTGDGTAPQGQQPAPQQADPYQQFYGYLQNVQAKLDSYEQERQQAVQSRATQSIDRFRNAKDAEGNAAHPYLDRVEGAMAELLVTPKYLAIEDYSERLQKAYEAAVYLDPDIKSQIVDSEVQKRLKAEREKSDVAKAMKARAPVKSAPVAPATTKRDNLADAVRASMNALG